MVQGNWHRVRKIFHEALRHGSDERELYLEKACKGDIDLRIEVESLLVSLADAKTFLEQPLFSESPAGSDTWQLSEGKKLSHYRVISPIATGGMGEVYLAEDERLHRRVALKILPKVIFGNEERLRRFEREAKVVSALNHPNVLTVYEFGSEENIDFLACEYVSGATLRSRLEIGVLEISEALDIATQTTRALRAAHEAGVIHRDIKPENIMIRDDGYVKVLDFGLAKPAEGAFAGWGDMSFSFFSQPGIIMGTASYMSPEQARAMVLDERSDLFSLGVVIYEMLAGFVPFRGETTTDVVAAVLQEEYSPIGKICSEVPPELERIVQRLLEKEKMDRYQSAAELLADLENIQPIHKAPPAETAASAEDVPATGIDLPAGKAAGYVGGVRGGLGAARFVRGWWPVLLAVLGVLVMVAAGFYYWLGDIASGPEIKSIAVLPFKPLSAENRDEALELGITNTLITSLSGNRQIEVRPITSVRRFGGLDQDPFKAGRELRVGSVLEGSVQRWDDTVYINVQLLNVDDNSVLWAENFDGKFADIIVIQDTIAKRVTASIAPRLAGSGTVAAVKFYTKDVEAWEYYSRATFQRSRLTPNDVIKSIEYYQKAIDRDPDYALAHAGIARSYIILQLIRNDPPTAAFSMARAEAEKALEIDSRLAEAHAVLGWVLFWYDWNWAGAEDECRQAIDLDPFSSDAHYCFAHVLSNTGRHNEALIEMKRARELDPVNPRLEVIEGQFLLYAGRTDEAMEHLQKTIDAVPDFWHGHLLISSTYTEKGMYEEAIAEADTAMWLSGVSNNPAAIKGYALAKAGKTAEAHALLDDLARQAKERFVPPYYFAMIHNGLGETDKAIRWLNRGITQRDSFMVFLKVEPKWDNLRSNPQFIEIMQKMNFNN